MENQINSDALQALREKVIAKGIASGTSCYVANAKGALITDVNGKEYLDFGGGIAVMNVGHSHPKVVAAIKNQADKFTHTCFMVAPYDSAVRLADILCQKVPGAFAKSAMFANSGAEAVENAVKIARYHTRRPAVIAFENAFHGRTLLTMSLTSKVKPYKFGFGPFAPEIYRMPFAYCYRCPYQLTYPSCNTACADALEGFFINHVAPEHTAAIILEPVQGEGGFIVPPPEFIRKIKATCEKYDILFIADEIQTGIGRTGSFFAMEHFDVVPDLTTVAKSLAAGLPLSAVVGKKDIMDSVHPSGIGGTYGANPIACEAALAVMDIFDEEDLLKRANILGEALTSRLTRFMDQYEFIGDVRGIGPMMAMELVEDRVTRKPAPEKAKALVKSCFESGLILLSCGAFGNVIRFLMPLVITPEELNRGLDIVEDGLKALKA
jgi:4-aminobutyrate aminotransferase / (S)-3-amino-2-methylpropionate transaminase / 5-aminovalerate transaminase